MKQTVEKLLYMSRLLKNEFPEQEWERLQNNNICRNEIAQDLDFICKMIDCNIYICPKILIKCLDYNNIDSDVVCKIAYIRNGDDKIHASKLADVLTEQELDEVLIALIKSGFKEYAKYLIHLDVK